MPTPSEAIRVLHVVPWITSGGVEKRRLLLVKHLSAPEFEHRMVCLNTRGGLVREIEAHGVSVRVAGTNWQATDLRALRAVVREIDDFRPHIVHGAVFEGVIQAALASVLRPRPRLVLEEIDLPIDRSVRGSAYAQLLFQRAHACVAVSDSVAYYMQKVLRLPEERVVVITNGIEDFQTLSPEERAQVRSDWGFRPEHFVIASVGRMHEHHKRMSDTLAAVQQLSERVPEVRMVLIGDGPDRGLLEARTHELGLTDRVRFLGYQREVGRLLGGADVFASASNRESFGQVIVEGMLAGLPVVTTPIGGPGEIVIPHRTGLFVAVGQPESMAEALWLLYRDPEQRARLGQAGRARAIRHYSSKQYAGRVAELYRGLR